MKAPAAVFRFQHQNPQYWTENFSLSSSWSAKLRFQFRMCVHVHTHT